MNNRCCVWTNGGPRDWVAAVWRAGTAVSVANLILRCLPQVKEPPKAAAEAPLAPKPSSQIVKPSTVQQPAKTAAAAAAAAAAAQQPQAELVGRRVKLKDGREGTIQAAGEQMNRFEVRLDNGGTVRLHGPKSPSKQMKQEPASSSSASPSPSEGQSLPVAKTPWQPSGHAGAKASQIVQPSPQTKMLVAPMINPRSRTPIDLTVKVEAAASPALDDTQRLAAMLWQCHMSPRGSPIASPLMGRGNGSTSGSPSPPVHPAMHQPSQQFARDSAQGSQSLPKPEATAKYATESEAAAAPKRASKRLVRQVSVSSIDGGSTPRRRAGDHPAPRERSSSSSSDGMIGNAVSLPDGRCGVVLSSGHGFFEVKLDRQFGGGSTKVRGAQLTVRSTASSDNAAAEYHAQAKSGNAASSHEDDQPEEDEDEDDDDGTIRYAKSASTQYSSDEEAEAMLRGGDDDSDGNSDDDTEIDAERLRGPLGPPVIRREVAMSSRTVASPRPERREGGYSGPPADLVGKAVRMPDGRTGKVLDSGHGFFTIRLPRGVTIKMRGAQLQLLPGSADSDDDSDSPGGAAPRRLPRSESRQRNSSGGSSGGQGGSASASTPLPPAKVMIGKTVRMPNKKIGTVLSSGHGFFHIEIDEADGGGYCKLRGAQIQIVERSSSNDAAADEDSDDKASRAQAAAAKQRAREAREARAKARLVQTGGGSGGYVGGSGEGESADIELLPHCGDVELTYTEPGFECSTRLARIESSENSGGYQPLISVGDLVSLVCSMDCRRRAAYIVADLKDKFHQRFQYCRITRYGRPVPMVNCVRLPEMLELLTRHSAVSPGDVDAYRASPRHAWLLETIEKVQANRMSGWNPPKHKPAETVEEDEQPGDPVWYEIDWDTVWMKARHVGWTTSVGARRTDLFYVLPGVNRDDEGSTLNVDYFNSKDAVRRYLAVHGLEQQERQQHPHTSVGAVASNTTVDQEDDGDEEEEVLDGQEVTSTPPGEDDRILHFGSVSIRVTNHNPLRLALRDILAIVCRVDMKRAGGRVNKLKAKLPPSIIQQHTFGTTSPRRATAVVASTELATVLGALPQDCVDRFKKLGDKARLVELLRRAQTAIPGEALTALPRGGAANSTSKRPTPSGSGGTAPKRLAKTHMNEREQMEQMQEGETGAE
jgi:hypothetical protein